MTKVLKVGIAGHGMVGKRRHSFIDAHPEMKVVAASDRKYDQNNSKINQLSIYNDFRTLLECESLDVFFVCLPNDVAAEATIEGLKKGCHVFCEKPPGRNIRDIQLVREAEKKYPNLKLKYGFNHRYHDSIREALGMIKGGKLGEVVNLRGVYGKSAITPEVPGINDINHPIYWRAHRKHAGGGILLDQGIHMVDLMRCFAGEFVDIKSFISNDFWQRDVEDNAYALMKSETGVVAMLHSSATQWRHRFSLEITLQKGSLFLAGILSSTKSYGQETLTISYREQKGIKVPGETMTSYIHDNSWAEEIRDFKECILRNDPITVGTSLDAYKTMELVYKIYLADKDWSEKYNIKIK
jgi:predicted dehydrogenase